jgi:hypothetical protein
MTTRTRLVAACVTAWTMVAAPRDLFALIEPSRAQADVDAAMRDKEFTFCSEPHRPLSGRARALCGTAGDIPSCAGFAAACAEGRSRDRWTLDISPAARAVIGWVARIAAWLVVLGLVLALLVPIARVLARSRRSRALVDPEDAPTRATRGADPDVEVLATTDEDVLLERADDHSNRGEYAIALQLYLAASLRALDKRGAVRMARDRTNGEYLRSCKEPDAKAGLSDLVREVDRVQFGSETATREAVDRAAQRATAIVRGLQATLVVLAAGMLLGCGWSAGRERRPGDDPAGNELLLELLHRQDVRAGALEGSLASLPLPHLGERTPAVIVDAERTEMDDETRVHLIEWVDAGGTLVLAGAPHMWPDELGVVAAATTGSHQVSARRLLARTRAEASSDDDEDDENDDGNIDAAAPDATAVYASTIEHGAVEMRAAIAFPGSSERVAWFDDQANYAAVIHRGRGWILGMASDELLTNAGLARSGNAAAAVAILSNADRLEFKIAQPEDGLAPPTTPLTAMNRAGLGLGMMHALVAAILLFLAAGIRMARATPAPPPVRRAFVEHVEAIGALYARTGSAEHALAAYARFAEERLRARMPRGANDVAAFLASRARLPLDVCERVWKRATASNAVSTQVAPEGDDLAVLKELSAVYSAATAQDK